MVDFFHFNFSEEFSLTFHSQLCDMGGNGRKGKMDRAKTKKYRQSKYYEGQLISALFVRVAESTVNANIL